MGTISPPPTPEPWGLYRFCIDGKPILVDTHVHKNDAIGAGYSYLLNNNDDFLQVSCVTPNVSDSLDVDINRSGLEEWLRC